MRGRLLGGGLRSPALPAVGPARDGGVRGEEDGRVGGAAGEGRRRA